MKKHIARPIEFSFTADYFKLIAEETTDGARVQAEVNASKAAKIQQEVLQRTINLDTLNVRQDGQAS